MLYPGGFNIRVISSVFYNTGLCPGCTSAKFRKMTFVAAVITVFLSSWA